MGRGSEKICDTAGGPGKWGDGGTQTLVVGEKVNWESPSLWDSWWGGGERPVI